MVKSGDKISLGVGVGWGNEVEEFVKGVYTSNCGVDGEGGVEALGGWGGELSIGLGFFMS